MYFQETTCFPQKLSTAETTLCSEDSMTMDSKGQHLNILCALDTFYRLKTEFQEVYKRAL